MLQVMQMWDGVRIQIQAVWFQDTLTFWACIDFLKFLLLP